MKERFNEFIIMFLIGALSFGLLAYIGDREANTKYPDFEYEKVISQARPIQFSLEKFLNAGLPLTQFVGFDTLVKPIVKVDDAIDAITVLGRLGGIAFQQITPGVTIDPIIPVERNLARVKILKGANSVQVFIPLRSRFGFSGQLVIHVPQKYIQKKIDSATFFLPWLASIGALSLGLYGAIAAGFPAVKRAKLDGLIFGAIFLVTAGSVVVGLARLYAEGSQTKAEGFGLAITERLRSIYDLGLSLDDLEGVDTTLNAYDDQNPEIQNIALVVNNEVVIASNPAMIGKPLTPDRFGFNVITKIDGVQNLDAAVYLSMPFTVAALAVGRTTKTFVVLLVASGFMAGLFFQLGGALRRLKDARRNHETDGQSAVEAIKPVLFVGFLIENLAASFLPQLMQKSAEASGLPSFLTSFMFMAYFVTFALTLVPAGIFAGNRGARPLILLGAVLAALAALIMAFSENYLAIVASRLLSGVGQGMLFIGSQSYILAYAAADKRTQSAGIIVYTFNGGMLSGLVIGGLLASYIGSSAVFSIAAISAIAIFFYTWALIDPSPPTPKSAEARLAEAPGAILSVFRSGSFVWTTLLVGIPAKAVLTGVIFFAMPLLLNGQKLAQEDIGQIIMFYAVGVLVSSHFISRFADRGGNLRWILFSGLALSGVGLLVIGGIGWEAVIDLALGPISLTIIMLIGTFTIGVGHGCINAPVVTHIASTDVARRLGEAPVTAFYRFIERTGHIAGPIVVGQLFLIANQSPAAIAWLGGAMMLFAVAFALYRPARPSLQDRQSR